MLDNKFLTLKATILYIIEHSETDKRDVYGIVKTAFYAQQRHFAEWGTPLFDDKICALPFGPVPSAIYDILKIARGDAELRRRHISDDLGEVAKSISFSNESFFALEKPDMDYLSESDKDSLDYAILHVSKLSFDDICNKTHNGAEYKRASKSNGHKIMDNVAIAREGGASDEAIAYLQEYFETNEMLSQCH